jgi:hypothetical protein
MKNDIKGSTSGTILVILLVIVVGFIVWYVTDNREADQPEPGVEINLGGNDRE